MKVLQLLLVVEDDAIVDEIAEGFYNSPLSQEGMYCLGHETRELTEEEQDLVNGELNLDEDEE